MCQLKSNHSSIHYYQNIENPAIYIEVVTYPQDGHFYYKEFTGSYTYYNYSKLVKIRKGDLLTMLKDYIEIENPIVIN